MTKLARKHQKIFGSGAANNGQFGSAVVGTKVTSSDVETLQALAAYLAGWDEATVGSQKLPTLEEFQALHYITNYQLAYLFQEGVSEWNTDTEYHKSSMVKSGLDVYVSKTDTNSGNALTDTANWLNAGSFIGLINEANNLGISATVAASALTVALKQQDGSTDPSADIPAFVPIRGTGQNVGSWTLEKIASSLSLVVPSGATLGTKDGEQSRLYVYLIKDSTNEVGISHTLFDESELQSSVAIDASADSIGALYSTNAKAAKPVKIIGHIDITEAAAGTWSSAPTTVNSGSSVIKNTGLAFIKDVKSNTTEGGTSSASYAARVINTLTGDKSFVTVTNGTTGTDGTATRFTLAPGEYDFGAKCPMFQSGTHKAKLVRDPAGSPSDELIGDQSRGGTATEAITVVNIEGPISVATETTFEIQQRGEVSKATTGLGRAASFGEVEIYTQAWIRKIK